MNISIQTAIPQKHYQDCLIVGAFEGGKLTPTAKELDKASQGKITNLINQGTFQGKLGQILPLFHLANTKFALILLIGCGKEEGMTPIMFRRLALGAHNAFKTFQFKRAVNYLSEINVKKQSLAWKVRQITEAIYDSLYRFDLFKTEKEPAYKAADFIIYAPPGFNKAELNAALKQGEAIAAGVIFTKNLGNTPSNVCTPEFLAAQAKDLAKVYSQISVKIINENEMRKLGMGAFLGVAQGSSQDAKLICIEYKGGKKKGENKKVGPIALVGKGITFDTGGNSLKPADSMVGMKYDMCGGATVLGTLKAAAELQLPVHLIGIIAAAENMPGGTAYKPEDILTSLSGQTIEVLNTDAEGRLVLADALTYCERYKPEVVIDIATLTGAAVIALGVHASAVLTNNEDLSKALLDAGIKSNDRAWPLPLWDEYQEQLKSPFADVANVGGRPAGTITAACFLSRFAKKFAWAHLDVAGTAAMMFGTTERYATGRPVPLLMQYIIDRVQNES